jgi:hypothetical protein
MNYDKDDDEADRIYQEVDEKMDKRRRARRLVIPIFVFSIFPSHPCYAFEVFIVFFATNRYRCPT